MDKETSDHAAGPRQGLRPSHHYGITAPHCDDWNIRCRVVNRSDCSCVVCDYDRCTKRNQFARESGEPVNIPIGKPVQHSNILTFGISQIGQTGPETLEYSPNRKFRTQIEPANRRHCGLLGTRSAWPNSSRTGDKGDERAALHSITSSARAISEGGTVRPSAFAVFKLITNSNFLGCNTGKSAGLSPLRMRPA